jgi:heterotetrameric sarcosine oxidase gamma subunit
MARLMESAAPAVRRGALDNARQSETLGAPPAVGLSEIGPSGKLLVLGPEAGLAVGRLLAVDIGPKMVHAGAAEGVAVEAWLLAPDEALLLIEVDAGDGHEARMLDLVNRLSSDDVTVIDVSSGWTVLRIAGAGSPAILAELLTVDVDPRTLTANRLVQGPLAGVRAIVARQDTPSEVGYSILVARDHALYVWEALLEIGRPHGLGPASPASTATAAPIPTAMAAAERAR